MGGSNMTSPSRQNHGWLQEEVPVRDKSCGFKRRPLCMGNNSMRVCQPSIQLCMGCLLFFLWVKRSSTHAWDMHEGVFTCLLVLQIYGRFFGFRCAWIAFWLKSWGSSPFHSLPSVVGWWCGPQLPYMAGMDGFEPDGHRWTVVSVCEACLLGLLGKEGQLSIEVQFLFAFLFLVSLDIAERYSPEQKEKPLLLSWSWPKTNLQVTIFLICHEGWP